MKDGYYILLNKIDSFIKRFYVFKILKGIFLSLSYIIFILILESIFEYYSYNSIFVRSFLFYFSILVFLSISVYYILIPLLSLFRIGRRIDFKQAADIISRHFPEVDDNLINTIELGQNIDDKHNRTDLLIASIERRTQFLNPISFKQAISFKALKKPIFYFFVSLIVAIVIFSFSPHIFTDGTYRIIDHTKYFEPAAPFQFVIQNDSFFVQKGNDFIIDLLIKGDYIPNDVFIAIGNNNFLMNRNKEEPYRFNFDIKNLNNSIDVHFVADNFNSKNIHIKVLNAPILKNFIVEVSPPSYTGIQKTIFKNSGDLNIPHGSIVKWNFLTNFCDSLFLNFKNNRLACTQISKGFYYSKQLFKSGIYSIALKNKYFALKDDISYQINIIPDLYPQITVHSVTDSVQNGAVYYMLNVKDDYGFKKLRFRYRFVNKKSDSKFIDSVITINKSSRNQDVFYYFDFNKISSENNRVGVEYYFEVFDNDYISGYKSTKSNLLVFHPKTRNDLKQQINEHEDNTTKSIEETKKLIDDIQRDIQDFKRKELNNEVSEWEKKNFLKNISEKQKALNKQLDKIKNENESKNRVKNQVYKENQEILKKQQEIQKILDELMDKELKALLEEIEKLKSEFNQQEFEKLKNKIDLSYKDLDKNLDKSLELLKRFQVEEKIQNLSEDLDRLSKRQEDLADKDYKKNEREEQKVNQNSIKQNFESLKKDLKSAEDKNSGLKRPYKLKNFEEEFNDIEKSLNDVHKDLDTKSDKKINKQRKEISNDMKNLSNKMEDMLQEMSSMALEMNMEDLRQIIDNLNRFSFAQEDVYNDIRTTYNNDPHFSELLKQENKLISDFSMINDSLNALASRIPEMSSLIVDELKDLNFSLAKTIYEFEQGHRRAVSRYQRNIMNSTNKLALYLDELNDQLQKQLNQSSSGKGKNKKPSNAMQKLKQQQESLKKQLEQLLNEMKKNGGKKQGNSVDKEIVKSLAEQEIFNKMINEMQNSEGLSPESSKKLKEIKRLSDRNINDLIDKNISQDLLKRNQLIKTRLLEAENAERKREKEQIRESKDGKIIKRKFPKEIEDFLLNNNQYKETLQKNNLHMLKFYENLSKDYYQRIK